MSKPFLIRAFSHGMCFTFLFLTGWAQGSPVDSGDKSNAGNETDAVAVDGQTDTNESEKAAEPKYPLMIAVDGNAIFTVDLDLPGVWKSANGNRELFFKGSSLLRKPMNRPRPITMHPGGGIIVGDSASREIYHIKPGDTEGKPLNGGYLGIPMAITLSPDGKTLFVSDAERRAIFKLPIDGVADGDAPELVAQVNARGLAFADDQTLYAATPDADAVVKINLADGKVTPVITDRPYQYVNAMVWAGDHGYLCDVYSKAIWKFTPDGATEKWFEGKPLIGPVGMDIDENALYVADPKQKQVYQIDRKTKAVTERF